MVSFFYSVLCVSINYFEYAIFRVRRRGRHVFADWWRKDRPSLQRVGWVIGVNKIRMPTENFPAPPPTISFSYLPVIVSSIYLASCFFLNVTQDSIPCVLPPPTFLVFSLNALVLLLSALSFSVVRNRSASLIRSLFPTCHERRSRGRDVWQALELNPIIFWYVTGEMPETLEVVVAKYTER